MSEKKEITKKILSLLQTLPKEKITHYASFKNSQIQRFQDKILMESVSEKDLKLQYIALKELVNDKYKNYYRLDEKIFKPKANPKYYDRLMSEINGEKKESLFSAFKTVVFGK